MKSFQSILVTFALLIATAAAFRVAGGATGGSSFVLSRRTSIAVAPQSSTTRAAAGVSNMRMGSQAKFGVFSPAVYAAKVVLGQDKLNKIRGKAISLHSQYIGEFCEWAGAYHLRTKLIKKAKVNGDTLGFLV
ncbi:predicted protein [Phaeodactylum tricornutum CCAP 1055/1]|jgi:hypothetical protein|uniref:Uncharacterized protein n=2 Tax=Phaeodactylum tricornutum TaxID=2850 RepID=B7FVH9_PHATC|nr:predicted protein [Phaeodactylum tricornutum CCAP 1055/1]EEC49406.1 predicted protein [Phaeodactylum tricornutum CCAP 1055/1]|eukprot:XP_002178708.1 predicted protein [Phaeodactylum tricornutum CCAP 1055/1]